MYKKLKKNNSGFVLIVSIVFMVFLSILLGVALLRNNIELQESEARLASEQAFYAAEAGLQNAVYQIRLNNTAWIPIVSTPPTVTIPLPTPVQVDSTFNIGTYYIEIANAPNVNNFQSFWVKSYGWDKTGKFERAILAQVIYQSPTAFLISTAGNLHISMGADIESSILAQNIYFDSSPADPITVTGTVDFLSSVNGNTGPPAVNLGPPGSPSCATPCATYPCASCPTVQHYSAVTFPGVDTSYYNNLAPTEANNPASLLLPFSGNIGSTSATADSTNLKSSNGVVYVDGNIHIHGNIQSSMLIVASGDIYIDGDITPDSNIQGPTPELGLLAQGDVYIAGNQAADSITINAFIMANGIPNGKGAGTQGGVFEVLDNTNTPGQAAAPNSKPGTITFTGSMALQGGNNVATAANLNAYKTRVLKYDPLVQTIPYLPLIANIVSWQEQGPSLPGPANFKNYKAG